VFSSTLLFTLEQSWLNEDLEVSDDGMQSENSYETIKNMITDTETKFQTNHCCFSRTDSKSKCDLHVTILLNHKI